VNDCGVSPDQDRACHELQLEFPSRTLDTYVHLKAARLDY
jgi:hypothetical protein